MSEMEKPERGLRSPQLFARCAGTAALVLFATACSPQPRDLAVGDKAPEFTLPTAQGADVSLSQFRGRSPVLLYFHMAVG